MKRGCGPQPCSSHSTVQDLPLGPPGSTRVGLAFPPAPALSAQRPSPACLLHPPGLLLLNLQIPVPPPHPHVSSPLRLCGVSTHGPSAVLGTASPSTFFNLPQHLSIGVKAQRGSETCPRSQVCVQVVEPRFHCLRLFDSQGHSLSLSLCSPPLQRLELHIWLPNDPPRREGKGLGTQFAGKQGGEAWAEGQNWPSSL